jgi:hypothetical protein
MWVQTEVRLWVQDEGGTMSTRSERRDLLRQAKKYGVEVQRGESNESIDRKIQAAFSARHEAVRNWNKR